MLPICDGKKPSPEPLSAESPLSHLHCWGPGDAADLHFSLPRSKKLKGDLGVQELSP